MCEARGWPTPEVEWQRNGQTLSSDGGVVSESSTMSATVTVLARLTWTREFLDSDAGGYQCVVCEPSTNVSITFQTVLLKGGNSNPPITSCSAQELSVYFQIRVFATDCESWKGALAADIASEFHNELLNTVKTECGSCELDDGDLQVLGSPQCSSKVNRAAVFRGQIQTGSQANTQPIFCALFKWQQRSPLIQINDQFHAVDDSCFLRASSFNNEECISPDEPQASIDVNEIAAIVAGILLILLLLVTVVSCVCWCYRTYYDGNVCSQLPINT